MEVPQMSKKYRVYVYETGPEGRVNLWALFNYMQDIASEHAVNLGFGRDDLLKRNHFPCSAEINYLAESVYDEDIFVRTSEEQGTNIFFNHSVFRKNDNKELCRIRIEWKKERIKKSPQ